jgi:hypothetical protein
MTPLALLAPDLRAVLELVLRQDRSYGELSELLGIPEREVRDRAEAALRALAGDPEDSRVDTGRITDWLLGQQTERAAAATRSSVAASAGSRAWASRAAERLREVGGERTPDVPGDAPADAPRPRPLREEPAPGPRPAATTAGPAPSASRLGGAVFIGVVALVLVAVLVWPVGLLRGGDDDTGTDSTPSAQATATPTATASGAAGQQTGNDILLKAVNGSKAEGLMRLFKAQNGGVQFAIGAQNVPNNKKNESYAVWFTRKGVKPKLLGFPQTQVTNGVLTVGGPGKGDEGKFPQWFATYDKVLITRETQAKPPKPGPAVLEGALPRAAHPG